MTTQQAALESIDVVLRALGAVDGETVAQAARRVIDEGGAPWTGDTLGAAAETLINRTIIALTLRVATADDSPLWFHVFEAAELAKSLGLS
jgi:hypothetical protein